MRMSEKCRNKHNNNNNNSDNPLTSRRTNGVKNTVTLLTTNPFFVFQKKIEQLHEAVVKNNLSELQANLTRRKLAVSKCDTGHGLLHRAVYHGHRDIAAWLLDKFPETAEVKDWVSQNFFRDLEPFFRQNIVPLSG